jgi:hypothetical protein
MGANAQTSVPTFTAGEILTAANMNISARTGIPVFADATARDAAFGGTGEKTLAEGQFAYLESTNATQYYDGAAWQSVAVSPGLVLISATTIGTTVSSVTVTGAFSSTYDNYLITLSGGAASAPVDISWKLDAASNYYFARMYLNYNTGTFNGDAAQNSTQFSYGFFGGADGLTGSITVMSPNLAKRTSYTGSYGGNVAGYPFQIMGGFQNANTQHTAFTIAPASGTLTGGTIRVYGYANS